MMSRSLFLPLLHALALAWLAPTAAEEPDLERQRHDLATIERQVSSLRQDLAAQREQRARLLGELEQSERDVASLARAGHQLDVDIAEQRDTVARLRKQLEGERQALAREQRALGQLMRTAYAAGRADRLRLLLNQEDAERLSRMLAYYDYINQRRLERIAATRARAEALQRLATLAEEEAQRLQGLATAQRATRERLEAAQARRSRVLDGLEALIASRDEEILALEADAAALRNLILRLERMGQIMDEVDVRLEPLSERRGRLPWPVPGRILVHYGAPKDVGGMTWDGVVLAAAEGSPVRAVHPGRVVFADWLRGFGLLLIIDHEDGYLTLYGNNQSLLKDPGEWVMAGETVALSGTTGGRGAAGLYFAMRHNGKPLDPASWCSPAARFEG